MSVSTTQPFAGTFAADPAHSSFVFTVKHMRVASFSARFDEVDARVVADDERGIRLEGAARVESVSIRNPPEFRERVVYGADFFDAGKTTRRSPSAPTTCGSATTEPSPFVAS